MPQALWDASALAKRYYTEAGTDTVDAVFAALPAAEMTVTYLGYTETAAILRRKYNAGVITLPTFNGARLMLQQETLGTLNFRLLVTDEADMLNAVALVDRHNINASDAIILTAYLRHARTVRDACIVVAADRRLLRACAAEGMKTLNPQQLPPADVSTFLAAL